MNSIPGISAIILAAGLSTRMGRPKLVLPWGETTVIGQVIATLAQAGLQEIVVVTGGARTEVEAEICRCSFDLAQNNVFVRMVFNPRYAEDAMMLSLQAGLSALGGGVEAALVVLGDQPQIEASVVQELVNTYRNTRIPLLVPSYQMRRGHPWVVDRSLWQDLLSAPSRTTLRDFLNANAAQIHYLPVETISILQDLDTPGDYERLRPS
jgi:molybdenum cofactor cytidylyltransferase